MKEENPICTLFVDIGGVLLTDGWGRHARKRAMTHFKLESAEMEDRHQHDLEYLSGGTSSRWKNISTGWFSTKAAIHPG